ncbi:MAG TPA: hypothetical protein VGV87_21495 [Blastocatellia bacterium]|nr:hypothetical protein [Blastocatellia bacterium]
MSRDNGPAAHYAGNPSSRITRRMDRLNEIVRAPNSPSVHLTRYSL